MLRVLALIATLLAATVNAPFALAAVAKPTITKVVYNLTASPKTMTVTGTSFVSPVTAKIGATPLTVASFTANSLVAYVPSTLAAGDYLLTVTNSGGSATWTLTYGAVGPRGPQGPRGVRGLTGVQGPQGIQGATGAPGATGATGAGIDQLFGQVCPQGEFVAGFSGEGQIICINPFQKDVTENLVVRWTFDDCNVNDVSGNGNGGGFIGAPQCVVGVNGGSALKFSEVGDYAVTASPVPSDFPSMTISAWVKLSNLSQQGGGVVGLSTDAVQNTPEFSSIVFGELAPQQWENGSENGVRYFSPPLIETSTDWIHLAITYSPYDIRMYRNGLMFGEETRFLPAVFSAGTYFYAGIRYKAPGGGRNFFIQGAIDDARLYSKSLTGEQILDIYESTRPR